jgi:hypothetical protein
MSADEGATPARERIREAGVSHNESVPRVEVWGYPDLRGTAYAFLSV